MNRLSIVSRAISLMRANSLKGIAIVWSWVFIHAMPVLAQKPAAGQIVAAEIKGLPTHENSNAIEVIFTAINYITGIALAGVVIFGLIWLLKRRNIIEDAEAEATGSTSGATEAEVVKEETKAEEAKTEEAKTEDVKSETVVKEESAKEEVAEQKSEDKAAD